MNRIRNILALIGLAALVVVIWGAVKLLPYYNALQAFDEQALAAMREYIKHRITQPHFANARSIRNALDRARLRQANRLFAEGTVIIAQELMRIAEDDIRASRVFDASSS